MGPTCKTMNLCCENGHFNMGAMDICSLLGPSPSGFSMYCSFSHFRVGFIFQMRMLPLGLDERYVGEICVHTVTQKCVKFNVVCTPGG